jgi:hypothetical protein
VVTEIRIYFEGHKDLRPGFGSFLGEIKSRARAKRIGCQVIACGGTAIQDYLIALKKHQEAWNILLKDSEGSDNGHLKAPPGTDRKSVFWMVQLMEAWFLADPDALEQYYSKDFHATALRKNPKVEEIAKADVLACLERATKDTQKGSYHKTKHAPALLERIDPERVKKASPNCRRLFREVLAKLDEG